jgi:hypothetical protein
MRFWVWPGGDVTSRPLMTSLRDARRAAKDRSRENRAVVYVCKSWRPFNSVKDGFFTLLVERYSSPDGRTHMTSGLHDHGWKHFAGRPIPRYGDLPNEPL